MNFTNDQIELVNKRKKEYYSKWQNATDVGDILSYRIRAEALDLLIELHNYQMKVDKEKKAKEKAKASELPDI